MEKPRLPHAAAPADRAAKSYLNVIAYDHKGQMPSEYRRTITPDYVRGLTGAPYMWNHLDGKLPALAVEQRTSHRLKGKLHERTDKIGTVVDAFYNGQKLYASVELREGATIPPKLAGWLENSLTDICWQPQHGKIEPIELSATPEGLRSGCRVVDQVDPESFRHRITMADFSKLPQEKRAKWENAMKAAANTAEMQALTADFDPSELQAFGSDFLGSTVAAIAGAKQLKSETSPVQQPKPTDPYRTLAGDMLRQKFDQDGVPAEVSQSFLDNGGLESWSVVQPLVASASKAAYERGLAAAGGTASGRSPDLPEPPAKRQKQGDADAMERMLKLHANNKAVQQYFPFA